MYISAKIFGILKFKSAGIYSFYKNEITTFSPDILVKMKSAFFHLYIYWIADLRQS